MLVLSERGAKAVSAIVQGTQGISDHKGGVRLAVAETSRKQPTLVATVVEEPESADAIVEAMGARVFIEPELGGQVADKQLDAMMAEGRALFRLREQAA